MQRGSYAEQDARSDGDQRRVGQHARIQRHFGKTWKVAFDQICMHEVIVSDRHLKDTGVTTMDVAKRLMDFGFHPPTVYFPLVVPEALMMEPTETESKETLDRFADVLMQIANEDAEFLKQAPHTTLISRPDEVKAAKEPVLRWK